MPFVFVRLSAIVKFTTLFDHCVSNYPFFTCLGIAVLRACGNCWYLHLLCLFMNSYRSIKDEISILPA